MKCKKVKLCRAEMVFSVLKKAPWFKIGSFKGDTDLPILDREFGVAIASGHWTFFDPGAGWAFRAPAHGFTSFVSAQALMR